MAYEGIDVMSAVQAWWHANQSIQLFSGDRKLWHKLAPEGATLPYTTFFLVYEIAETYTTAYPFWRDMLQINCHAETDVEARTAAVAISDSLKGAQLVIEGSEVMHCLPDRTGMDVGRKLGPNGEDCWIGFAIFNIAWTP